VQSRSVLGSMTRHGRPLALSAAMAVLLVGCASFSAPPTSAGPEVVLRAYLDALVHGDCSAGKVLGTGQFVQVGGGELCGATQVKSYAIGGGAPSPFSAEVVYATTLETTGSRDGSVPPGTITWFYDLKQQADGSWRLVGGGSGP
jgi:hypothetical protein